MEMKTHDVQARARELIDQLPPQLDEARRNLTELNSRALTYIRQNPGTCLLGAIAVGFIVGKLASRD